MIRATLETVAAYTGGSIHGAAAAGAVLVEGVSTDTRSIRPNNLFVPLIGERFNGHDYAQTAREQGASAVLWQGDQGEPPEGPAVIVEDTLQALQRMAHHYRMSLPVRIVGITGSNGKTTTKDMTAAVLAAVYRVHKTQGNLNNHIGLPLTLLSLAPDTEFAVIEMGMSGRGEIDLLTRIARPDAAVITNIGDAHLKQLGSRDEIAKAKLEICSGLAEGGTFVVPGDEPLIDAYLKEAGGPRHVRIVRFGSGESCDIRLQSVELSAENTRFRTNDSPLPFTIPMLGRHNANNALAAIGIGRAFGIADSVIAGALSEFTPSGMRIERVEGKGGTTLWNDAYNANVTSMKAALSLLSETRGYRRKFAVLGDMLELGPGEKQFHREIGAALSPASVDFVYTFGELGREIAAAAAPHYPAGRVEAFDSKEKLAEKLEAVSEPGDLILVKASRGMKLETVVQSMRAQC